MDFPTQIKTVNFLEEMFSHNFTKQEQAVLFVLAHKMQPILEASIKLRSKEKPVEHIAIRQVPVEFNRFSLMVYFLLLMTK